MLWNTGSTNVGNQRIGFLKRFSFCFVFCYSLFHVMELFHVVHPKKIFQHNVTVSLPHSKYVRFSLLRIFWFVLVKIMFSRTEDWRWGRLWGAGGGREATSLGGPPARGGSRNTRELTRSPSACAWGWTARIASKGEVSSAVSGGGGLPALPPREPFGPGLRLAAETREAN